MSHDGYVMLMDNDKTLTYQDPMNSSDSERWLEAIKSEMESMYQNKVLTLVDPLEGVKPIGYKRVFKKKTDMDSKVQTYKTRLVAKSFKQIHGIDFLPVTMVKFIRILLAIVAYFDYEIWQMDVKILSYMGALNMDVYMIQPKGFFNQKFAKIVYNGFSEMLSSKPSNNGIKQLSEEFQWVPHIESELPLVGNVAPDFDVEVVFDREFINNEELRSQWDLLSHGGQLQQMVCIAKGQDSDDDTARWRKKSKVEFIT
ncbi:hypothetical protein AgCh_017597 [Apium graveolens]